MKRPIYYLLVLAGVLIALYAILQGTGSSTRAVDATLYVNGERVDTPAQLYSYVGIIDDKAAISLPLLSSLESLGCHVEGNDLDEGSELTIQAGTREFVVKRGKFSSDLYENGSLIYSNLARPYDEIRGRGHLYINFPYFEEVLPILGFDLVSCELDADAKIVNLTTETSDSPKEGDT